MPNPQEHLETPPETEIPETERPETALPETELPETDERLSRKIKNRMCIALRTVGPMGEFLRFVLAPDGTLTPDLTGRLPGRGAHLTPTRAALDKAIKTKAFARAFKQPVEVDAAFPDHVSRLIHAHLLARLSMARRAGDLALGQDAVFSAAGSGKLCLLIQPHGGSANAIAKLSGIARDFPSLTFSTPEELGESLGKERIANLAFTHGHKAEQFLDLAHKFRDFLAPNPQ